MIKSFAKKKQSYCLFGINKYVMGGGGGGRERWLNAFAKSIDVGRNCLQL